MPLAQSYYALDRTTENLKYFFVSCAGIAESAFQPMFKLSKTYSIALINNYFGMINYFL